MTAAAKKTGMKRRPAEAAREASPAWLNPEVTPAKLDGAKTIRKLRAPASLQGGYGLICQGTCLEPLVHDGDTLVARAGDQLAAGDLVMVWPTGGGNPFAKILLAKLRPLNPKSEVTPAIPLMRIDDPRTMWLDPGKVAAMHKVIGVCRKGRDTVEPIAVPPDLIAGHPTVKACGLAGFYEPIASAMQIGGEA